MRRLIPWFCALLAANAALAQANYSLIMRQAHNAANAAGRGGQESPPPGTPPPALQNNPPSDPVLQATLQNIGSLQNDFAALASLTNAAAIAAQNRALTNDLATAAHGMKPSAQSISKLAGDLTGVIGGNGKLRAQYPKLAQYVHAACNGSQLSPAQQQMIFTGTQKILAGGGVSPDAATNVLNDLKAIASETK